MAQKQAGLGGDGRTPNWCFILWEDSTPPDAVQKLDELCISYCLGPWHDKDVNPDGEIKKAHRHGVFMFDGKKSMRQVQEILESCGIHTSIPIPCQSVRGAVRYFWHLDNPEKYSYPLEFDKCHFHACSYEDLCKPTSSEKDRFISEMQAFCLDNDITEFWQLADYARLNNTDWFHLLNNSCALVMNYWLRSRRHWLEKSYSKDAQ